MFFFPFWTRSSMKFDFEYFDQNWDDEYWTNMYFPFPVLSCCFSYSVLVPSISFKKISFKKIIIKLSHTTWPTFTSSSMSIFKKKVIDKNKSTRLIISWVKNRPYWCIRYIAKIRFGNPPKIGVISTSSHLERLHCLNQAACSWFVFLFELKPPSYFWPFWQQKYELSIPRSSLLNKKEKCQVDKPFL